MILPLSVLSSLLNYQLERAQIVLYMPSIFCILYPCDPCCIRESVDSLCRDGADAQYFKQKPYNFTTNTLKAYLRAQSSPLSAFMISKTHTSAQKSRGRQLNAKVCGSESSHFCLLSFFVQTTFETTITPKRLKYSPSFYHEIDAHHSVQLPNN